MRVRPSICMRALRTPSYFFVEHTVLCLCRLPLSLSNLNPRSSAKTAGWSTQSHPMRSCIALEQGNTLAGACSAVGMRWASQGMVDGQPSGRGMDLKKTGYNRLIEPINTRLKSRPRLPILPPNCGDRNHRCLQILPSQPIHTPVYET